MDPLRDGLAADAASVLLLSTLLMQSALLMQSTRCPCCSRSSNCPAPYFSESHASVGQSGVRPASDQTLPWIFLRMSTKRFTLPALSVETGALELELELEPRETEDSAVHWRIVMIDHFGESWPRPGTAGRHLTLGRLKR